MSNLPADVLDRPAPEVARWLALVRLHDLDRLRPALDDAHDGHAADELHDFRVALRRLRSVIRAHRAELDDSVSTKTRRRLQRLARASAPSRDATVHLAWLAEQEKDVTADQSPGVAWVRRQIRKDRRAGDRQLEQEIERDYARVSDRLHEKLSRYAEVHELEHD
ncbi:MAG TPA: CHAD domain-containing protein, partial [Candidatus Elarobacter sp.]|nr:CHAD domain-containing protein [Candidatus Elarobacter sp.]